MFSSTTTELSIRRDSTSARPPSTMVLMVLPLRLSNRKAARQEIGIESSTETVARSDAEENQDHDRGQEQAHAALAQHVLDGHLHVLRLIEDHVGHQVLGNIAQMGDAPANPIDDLDGVAVATLLQDRQVDRFLAVDAHDVVLQRR